MIKKRSLKLRITMWYSLFMFTITFALAAIVLIVINRNSETVIKEDLKSTVLRIISLMKMVIQLRA